VLPVQRGRRSATSSDHVVHAMPKIVNVCQPPVLRSNDQLATAKVREVLSRG